MEGVVAGPIGPGALILGHPPPPEEEFSDIELMVEVRDGHDAAFAILIDRHQRNLIYFFTRLTRNRDTAEDWAQEVFCRIYARRHQYEPRARFTTYLYRIARNHWIDHARKRGRRPREISLEEPGPGSQGESEGSLRERITGHTPAPIVTLEGRETLERLARAIEDLTDDQRLLYQLAVEQSIRYQEISEILEIPVGTVKSRMHSIMSSLRTVLQ